MSLGEQIHKLRKKHNLSQEQLAEKVGVARQTISKWELGVTAPDINQVLTLSQIFNVSLDELVFNATDEIESNTEDVVSEKAYRPWIKRIIALSIVAICLCILFVCIFSIVSRSGILHPQGIDGNVVITIKENLKLNKENTEMIVFSEINKPKIACQLPEDFVCDTERSGFYTDGFGNYIKFNADYAESVVNPLLGTDYYSYYEDSGYYSYMDMARKALYFDLSKVSVFSSKEQIYLAGGAQLIREQLCAGQNADYYEIDGGLITSGDKMWIDGFALHFENTTWLVTLKDFNDIYYFVTIKDPDGIGRTIDTVGELLGTISVVA